MLKMRFLHHPERPRFHERVGHPALTFRPANARSFAPPEKRLRSG